MTSGFYLAAIIGAVVSFVIGCIWYTFIFGKTWQKEMNFSNERIQEIFTPKRMIFAFASEWMSSFCTVGIFFNLQVDLIYKVLMLSCIVIFQGVKLSIFDGKSFKTILINEGYRFLSIITLAITYSIFL